MKKQMNNTKCMKSNKVSVVVPIYNVEKYVEKCILSLINQTLSNMEILLVDDGSTDLSGKICDQYAAKDDRIRVIHKENGGITSARRAGIQMATGDYIGFVDGDDWVDPNMYEDMLNIVKMYDLDILITAIYRDNDKKTYAKWDAALLAEGLYCGGEKEQFDIKILENGKQQINGSINNKLFATKLMKNNIKKMSDSIKGNCDDFLLLFLCLLEADKVYISQKAYYHGYDREGSASRSKVKEWYTQVDHIYDVMINAIKNHEHHEILRQQIDIYITNNIIRGIRNLTDKLIIPEYIYQNKNDISVVKRIIIYGAGAVGKSFFKQLEHMEGYQIVGWIDKNWQKYKEDYEIVSDISVINNIVYDYIIIANAKSSVVRQIRDNLLELGIPNEKIIAELPNTIAYYFNNNGI